uniref:Uncharacterized protein n=1 Tax=Pararge aegeria TaxID=116150 RepID=S4PDA8_9NEOP
MFSKVLSNIYTNGRKYTNSAQQFVGDDEFVDFCRHLDLGFIQGVRTKPLVQHTKTATLSKPLLAPSPNVVP